MKPTNVENTSPYRRRFGVADKLASCHTAVVDGYVIEGHVPASDIKRLLAEKPNALGLTAPGMPADAPGMDQGKREPYTTFLIDERGGTRVFARH